MEGLTELVAAACGGVEGLEAAIVFGSVLTSDAPGDVDLALLWKETLAPEERWARANCRFPILAPRARSARARRQSGRGR